MSSRGDKMSATKAAHSASIPGQVKPTTTIIDIYIFLAWGRKSKDVTSSQK